LAKDSEEFAEEIALILGRLTFSGEAERRAGESCDDTVDFSNSDSQKRLSCDVMNVWDNWNLWESNTKDLLAVLINLAKCHSLETAANLMTEGETANARAEVKDFLSFQGSDLFCHAFLPNK
jgi:hypothetical protein